MEGFKIPTIHITFRIHEPLTIPVNYQHALQSFVYSLFPQQEAAFLHDSGYELNKRIYKPFSFSSIHCNQTNFDKVKKQITFYDQFSLSVCSLLSDLLKDVVNELLLTKNVTFYDCPIQVETIEYEKNVVTANRLQVKALSPITVYSTYEKRDGTKITHYFTPWDKVFGYLIEENFARKYEALTGKSLADEKNLISIRPIYVSEKNKIVTKYKNTWITGWTGIYELEGKPEYLSFLLDAGLGAKNASGFGCIMPYSNLQKRSCV